MHNRRGIEITFNWIFSLIVGVIIFSFFVYFAVQNTDLFGKLTYTRVSEELDILFSSYKGMDVSTDIIFDKNIKLSFVCNEFNNKFEEKLFIGNRVGKSLKSSVVFAPNYMESSNYLLWVRDLSLPFKISNLIFFSDKNMKYFFYGLNNNELINDIRESKISQSNSDYDKVIIFSETNSKCVPNKNTQINYKKSKNIYYGYICQNEKIEPFVGKEMIYGAILSDDFGCLNKIVLNRFFLVSDLYIKKASFLNNDRCNYNGLINNIESLKEKIQNLDNNGLSYIPDDIENINVENKRLIGENCPAIF